ncbi:MAG: carboxypeptidase-like regulatory domain-containing protein [Thermoguttaceae bacterium]
MTYLRSILMLALSLNLVTLLGCGGDQRPRDLPKTYPVNVTIIQDGKPLADAAVTLMPDDTASRFSAVATTDRSGVARLKTLGMYVGVPVGKYRVLVTKSDKVEKHKPITGAKRPGPGGKGGNVLDELRKEYDFFNLIDPVFGDIEKTTLNADVQAQSNTLSFDVGKAIREKIESRR